MSKRLSEEEKRKNKLRREKKRLEKDLDPELDERGSEILCILREASDHPEIKCNAVYLQERLNATQITVYRAIKKLKDMDLIEERQVNGSYKIKRKVEQIYTKETQKNIDLIASMSGLLQQYEGTPLYGRVTSLIQFLEPKVFKEDILFSSGRVIVSPQIKYDIDIKNWDRVYEAIKKNRKIQFRYVKSSSERKMNAIRTVCPYQLILDNGSAYLSAYSEYAEMILLYDLNFMADIAITGETFKLPKNFDFNKLNGGGRLGAFKDDNTQTFKIRFTDYAKDWIKRHKWADDQKILKETDEYTTITFSSAQEEKVFEQIMKWGCQAEPLAPRSLVKRWKQEIAALWEKIQK